MLIADDNPAIVKAVSRLLAADHDVVGSVSNGRGLPNAIHMLQPDVIVLDLHLPDSDGVNLCDQVKRTSPEIKVIVFTAADHPETRRRAFDAGASAFVDKLSVPDELLMAVKQFPVEQEQTRSDEGRTLG